MIVLSVILGGIHCIGSIIDVYNDHYLKKRRSQPLFMDVISYYDTTYIWHAALHDETKES